MKNPDIFTTLRNSVCLNTIIGFRRCTLVNIYTYSVRVHGSLSILLTNLLSHIKQGLQKYYGTAFSRSRINQMWIPENSKELLDHRKSPNFNLITNIKSFDLSSTIFTVIQHRKLKSRLATLGSQK